jgi:hypothetical protein
LLHYDETTHTRVGLPRCSFLADERSNSGAVCCGAYVASWHVSAVPTAPSDVGYRGVARPTYAQCAFIAFWTHNGPRKEAGEPDGHPPIGDLDALTDCTALAIVNCPLQETHRNYFLDPAFWRTCCGKATVGGKRDRPTGLCNLAEPRRPSCCSSLTVYPKRTRRLGRG